MATPTIETYGKEGVLVWFNNQPGTDWRLHRQYNTKSKDNIVNGSLDLSKEEEYERLAEQLDSLDNGFNNGTYTLVVDNGKYPAQLYFKITQAGEVTKQISGINQTQTDPALLALLNKQQEQLNELTSRLNADDEEMEDEKEKGLMGLINHDVYGPLIATAISGIVSKLMPAPAPTALAGIPDEQEQKVNQAIEILKNYDNNLGDHLLKLADIAQNNNAQFNMLLKML
jgi:hypothetical protein